MATRSPHNHVAFSMWTSVWLRSFLHQKPSLSNEYPGSDYGFISEEERREALQELYGEDDEIEETPRFLRDKLELLEEELDQIHEKKSYELAVFANPNYVESDKFRLMFLRADRFDVRRAAKRIVAYWDRKLELFGPEKAFRPHRFDLDFECNDSFAVSRGGIRLLPHCDDAGRAIIFNCQLHDDNMNNCIDNMRRLHWMIIHAAIEDSVLGETVQRKGIICLLGSGIPDNAALAVSALKHHMKIDKAVFSDLQYALPTRVVGIHHFTPNDWFEPLFQHPLHFLKPQLLARYRQYNGISDDNLATLSEHGISPEILPLEVGGELVFDYHSWLQNKVLEGRTNERS